MPNKRHGKRVTKHSAYKFKSPSVLLVLVSLLNFELTTPLLPLTL